MNKILCYLKHEVDVILENELFYGGICYECDYRVITKLVEEECNHDLKKVGVKYSNNTIHYKDICIKCYKYIKTYKKSDFTQHQLNSILIRDIEIIDKKKNEMYEIIKKYRDEITIPLNEKREEIISSIYAERDRIRNEYYQSLEWKSLRLSVLNRDKYICQGCLKNQATEVHHQTYAHLKEEFMFELISLCSYCHSRYHNKL